MVRRPPRSTLDRSSAASDVYKRQGHRRVAVPPRDDGAAVDGQQVAGAQNALTGDAVHHLLVDRRAEGMPVARHLGEGRTPAVVADVSLGQAVQLDGGYAFGDRGADELKGAGVEQASDCLLYTSDAADGRTRVNLGGRGII